MVEISKMVVGLGNPGHRYQKTRHNIGFLVVEELGRRLELLFSEEKDEYLATGADFESSSVILLKPLTYMNLSGEALLAWAERSSQELTGQKSVVVPPPDDAELPATDDLISSGEAEPTLNPPEPITGIRPLVVCDDLALPLGAVRLRGKGRSGGQNGIQSIIEHLGGEEFPRLRLGIAPPDQPVDPEFWPDFVLAEFEPEEQELMQDVVNHAADTVEFWFKHSLEQTASRFNRRPRPGSEEK